jgi:hypothetical protein
MTGVSESIAAIINNPPHDLLGLQVGRFVSFFGPMLKNITKGKVTDIPSEFTPIWDSPSYYNFITGLLDAIRDTGACLRLITAVKYGGQRGSALQGQMLALSRLESQLVELHKTPPDSPARDVYSGQLQTVIRELTNQ